MKIFPGRLSRYALRGLCELRRDGISEEDLALVIRAWCQDGIFEAYQAHEISEEQAILELLPFGYKVAKVYHLLRTKYKRSAEPWPKVDPATLRITKEPSEDEVREMREKGLSEESIQETRERWHRDSIVTAFRGGAISDKEALRQLREIGVEDYVAKSLTGNLPRW